MENLGFFTIKCSLLDGGELEAIQKFMDLYWNMIWESIGNKNCKFFIPSKF